MVTPPGAPPSARRGLHDRGGWLLCFSAAEDLERGRDVRRRRSRPAVLRGAGYGGRVRGGGVPVALDSGTGLGLGLTDRMRVCEGSGGCEEPAGGRGGDGDRNRGPGHLTSEHAHEAFYGPLKKEGYKIIVRHVYNAEESKKLRESTVEALQKGEIAGVLFYSARTATIFQNLCRRRKVAEYLHSVCALGLSPAVAAACDKKLWKSIDAAQVPTHTGLMDCLAKVLPVDP